MVSPHSDNIPQVCRDWHNLTEQDAARLFQTTFASASILPNRTIMEVAKKQSLAMGGKTIIAPAGSDALWSVYLVGAIWLAIDVRQNETFRVTELPLPFSKSCRFPSRGCRQ